MPECSPRSHRRHPLLVASLHQICHTEHQVNRPIQSSASRGKLSRIQGLCRNCVPTPTGFANPPRGLPDHKWRSRSRHQYHHTAGPSPIPGLLPVSDEELGRKRASPHELSGTASTNDCPTSRPPPDSDSVAIQEHPKVEYRGTPGPQMAMSEVIERYSPRPASALKGTDNSAPSSSSSTARAAKTVPAYYPPFDKVSGIVVTRDANRIWQVAPRLNDKQFRDRQRAPLSSADQAQLRKLSIIANLSRTLRAFDTGICEKAWVQRVIRRLTTAHNNCLRPMQNNLNEQFSARYSLQAGETRETHSTFPRNLEALKPIPKNLIQRTRYCVMIDSTVPCDLP